MRKGAIKDQINATATSMTTPVTARKRSVTRKLLEANSSLIANHPSRALLEWNDCAVALSKGFRPMKLNRIPVDVLLQQCGA